MSLPFTREAFFDVFAAYNLQLWPFALVLWLATAYGLVVSMRARSSSSPVLPAVLAVQWFWAAVAYHATFFSRINPAAWLFCGLFLIEAGLLFWHGVFHKRVGPPQQTRLRQAVSWGLLAYGWLYPLIVRAEGHEFPRLPTFGVPCPTTILTIGFLLGAGRSLPRTVAVIPLLWAVIGGSAAVLFGVRADLMLMAAGLGLAADLLRRERSGATHFGSLPAVSSRH